MKNKSWDIVLKFQSVIDHQCSLLYYTTPSLQALFQLEDLQQAAAEFCFNQSVFISTAQNPGSYVVTCVKNYIFMLTKKTNERLEKINHNESLTDLILYGIDSREVI